MGLTCRMQDTGADVGDVYFVGSQLEGIHELGSCRTAALDDERDDAAALAAEILLCERIVRVGLQTREADALDSRRGLEELGDGHGVLVILLHADRKGLQTKVQQECGVSGRIDTEIAHELHSRLDDIRHVAVGLGVGDAVIGFIWLNQLRELAVGPVELAAVDDDAADLQRMSVHVFAGGVDDDIRTELKRTAENRGGEGVVDDQRDAHVVRDVGKALDVKHGQRRIGDRLTEYQLGIRLECRLDLLVGGILVDVDALDTELLEGIREQVDSAAVDFRRADEGVACLADIQDGQQGCRLSGCSAHRTDTALEIGDLFLNGHDRRVGKAGVAQTLGRIVKNCGDLGGGVIDIRGALYNRQNARLSVFRGIAGVQAFGFRFHIITILSY